MPRRQEAPRQRLTSQSKDLQEALRKIKELESENAALKEQMAAKEAGWDASRDRILKALHAERALLKKVKADRRQKMEAEMQRMEEEKTRIHEEAKHQINSMVERVNSECMAWARQEILTLFHRWKTEVRILSKHCENLLEIQEDIGNRRCQAKEEELSSVLEETASQLNQRAEEKAQLVDRLVALEARDRRSSALIKFLQVKVQHSETNWNLTVSDLEEKISLQQREMFRRESLLRDEVQLLTQKNLQLEVFDGLKDLEKTEDRWSS